MKSVAFDCDGSTCRVIVEWLGSCCGEEPCVGVSRIQPNILYMPYEMAHFVVGLNGPPL